MKEIKPLADDTFDEDDFPITEIIRLLWQSRRTIVAFLVVSLVATLAIGWTIRTYQSVGLFRLSVSLPEYKNVDAALADQNRWRAFAATRKPFELAPFGSPDHVRNALNLRTTFTPIYPYTKADLKDLPDAVTNEKAIALSGVRITFKSSDPALAKLGVATLTEYLRDTAVLLHYKESVPRRNASYLANRETLENQLIEAQYRLSQLQTKRAAMQAILEKYPQAAGAEGRQVVSIAEGGERYLAPTTQLIAIESSIIDQKQALAEIKRKQHVNDVWVAYYTKLTPLLEKCHTGAAFLDALTKLKDEQKFNLSDDAQRSVANDIAVEELNTRSRYVWQTGFIAPPQIPARPHPSLASLLMIGTLIGLMLGAGYTLLGTSLAKQTEPLRLPDSPLHSLRRSEG